MSQRPRPAVILSVCGCIGGPPCQQDRESFQERGAEVALGTCWTPAHGLDFRQEIRGRQPCAASR